MAGTTIDRTKLDSNMVSTESEHSQAEFGDCLKEGFVPNLPYLAKLKLKQNDPTDLLRIWNQWTQTQKREFTEIYGDIALLLTLKVDEELIRAVLEFWDPSYRCFSINGIDLTPTLEEYTTLLRLDQPTRVKVYIKDSDTGTTQRKFIRAFGQGIIDVKSYTVTKGVRDSIPIRIILEAFSRDLKKEQRYSLMAFAIYGLFIFPKGMAHIDISVLDFFVRLDSKTTPVPSILAETIRALNFLRQNGKGRFTGCLGLLYVWLQSHMPSKSQTAVRYEGTIPIDKFHEGKYLEGMSRKDWLAYLNGLNAGNVTWVAAWMIIGGTLYRCGSKSCVPLPGIWGAISYAPLQVRRQYGGKQFVPMTHDLEAVNFTYEEPGYGEKLWELAQDWKHVYYTRLGVHSYQISPRYEIWQQYKVRNVMPPSVTMVTEARPPQSRPLPLTNLQVLEKNFAEEREEWGVQRAKLTEELDNLKLDLIIKDGEVSKVKKQNDDLNSALNELRQDKRGKRKTSDAWHGSRQSNTLELEKVYAENKRLEKKNWSLLKAETSWRQEREEMLQKTESQTGEIQKLRKRVNELKTTDKAILEESERHRMQAEREVVQYGKLRSRNQVLTARILNLEETIKEGTESLKLAEDRILELTGSIEQAENQTSDITELLGKAESDIQELEEQVESLTKVVNDLEHNVNLAEDGWDQAIATRDEALLERNEALEVCDRALAARNQAIQRSNELEGIAERRLQWFNAHFHRYQRDAWKAERTLDRIKHLLGRIGLGTRGYNALLAMVHEVQVQYEHFVTPWRKIRAQAPDWPVQYDAYGGGIPEHYEPFVDEDVEELVG